MEAINQVGVLTHLDRENHRQRAMRGVRWLADDDLLRVRAWLLDVVEKRLSAHVELAVVRGEVVHTEIQTRARRSLAARLWHRIGTSDSGWLEYLSTLPDLPAPADLASKRRRR